MPCVSYLFTAESISKYIADENKVYDGVSSVPIQLTLSGPDLPALTLVDLPGECLIATMFVTCTIHSGPGISHVTLKQAGILNGHRSHLYFFFRLRASLCVNMSGLSLATQLIVLDSALIAHRWGKLPDSLINSVVPSLFASVVNNSCQYQLPVKNIFTLCIVRCARKSHLLTSACTCCVCHAASHMSRMLQASLQIGR